MRSIKAQHEFKGNFGKDKSRPLISSEFHNKLETLFNKEKEKIQHDLSKLIKFDYHVKEPPKMNYEITSIDFSINIIFEQIRKDEGNEHESNGYFDKD